MLLFIGIYLAAINLFSLMLTGSDKKRAIHHEWRVPEKLFIYLTLIGGGLGIILGCRIFHHKGRHKKFTVVIPLLTLVEWLAGIVVLLKVIGFV
jgi:uncharacterized membrane protein YsdA (DUF1294 family)